MRNCEEEEQNSTSVKQYESVTDIVQICDLVWTARQSSSIFNTLCKSLPDDIFKVTEPPANPCTALIVLPEPPHFTTSLPPATSIFRFSFPLPPPPSSEMTALVPYQPPVELISKPAAAVSTMIAKCPSAAQSAPSYPLIHSLNPALYQQYMALKVIYLCNSVRELQRAVRRNASIAKNKLYSAVIMSRISSLYHTYATLHSNSAKDNAVLSNTASVPALTEWDIDELLRKLRLDMRIKRRHAESGTARDIDVEYKTAIAEVQAWRSAVEGCCEYSVTAY